MTRSRKGPRSRGSFTSYTLPLDIALIVFGAIVALWRPSPVWVEQRFTNGYYPHWQQFLSSLTSVLPFALGDALIAAGIAVIVLALIFARPWWRMLVGIAAIAGLYAIWFYAGWGFGYDRAPVQDRTAYSASRVNPSQVVALRTRAIAQLNRLAPLAHAQRQGDTMDIAALQNAWTPVVQRLGDDWTPAVGAAKPALAGWFMDKIGTSGFTNPFTLETQLRRICSGSSGRSHRRMNGRTLPVLTAKTKRIHRRRHVLTRSGRRGAVLGLARTLSICRRRRTTPNATSFRRCGPTLRRSASATSTSSI